MKPHWSIFGSPGFILGLILLLINDHYLKGAFYGFIPGKLSDVAGLFIFPLFFSAFLPRFKKHVYIITAIGFVFWKSPLSSTLIASWNQLGVFTIQRIVDYTDLFTLMVLPFSYLYLNKRHEYLVSFNPVPVMIISAFAFIATSRSPEKIDIDKIYSFQMPVDTLTKRVYLQHMHLHEKDQWLQLDSVNTDTANARRKILIDHKIRLNDTIGFFIEDEICMNGFHAEIVVTGDTALSEIRLIRLHHHCHDEKKTIVPQLLKIFEEKFIHPLH